ncbi:uncharacterized protein [Branchiostoma lanceolatum]|uniref:uncharacterized protein n=1 Tax=Branchiostoma lanceolatum TaxID=7740 RepID=UPI003451FCCE
MKCPSVPATYVCLFLYVECQEVPPELQFCNEARGFSASIFLPNHVGHYTAHEILESGEYDALSALRSDPSTACHAESLAFACAMLAPNCVDRDGLSVAEPVCWAWCKDVVETNVHCDTLSEEEKVMFKSSFCDGLPVTECFEPERIAEQQNGYQQFNGKRYKIFGEKRTYDESLTLCESEGGSLAVPRNREVNQFLFNLIVNDPEHANDPVRFGLAGPEDPDAPGADSWTWADGSAFGAFHSWKILEPGRSSDRSCAFFNLADDSSPGTAWESSSCNTYMKFICEVPLTDCYYGRGYSYRGSWDTTELGQACEEWAAVVNEVSALKETLGGFRDADPTQEYSLEGNFCRVLTSPRAEVYAYQDKPMCFVRNSMGFLQAHYCSIPLCNNLGTPSDAFEAVPCSLEGNGDFSYSNARDYHCEWKLTIGTLRSVKLEFSNFALPAEDEGFCTADRVQVIEGSWPDGQYFVKGTFCGSGPTGPIYSNSSALTVVVHGIHLASTSQVTSLTDKTAVISAEYTDAPRAQCTEAEYWCRDGKKCVPLSLMCQGAAQCWDGSDQDVCECLSIPDGALRDMCPTQMYTAFPNFLRHLSVPDVTNWDGFLGIKQLSSKTCHQQIRDFVCYLVVPPCSSVTRDPPCRSWCEELKHACGTETGWDQVPDCSTFANTNCWSGTPEVCYHGNGENYRGVQSQAATGQPCYRWEEKPLELQQYPWAHLRENYCRNPDGTDKPWCYVDQAGGWEFCSVKPCDESLLCRDRGSERGVLMKPVRQFYSTGDTVTYSCVQGYTLLGSAAARCLGNHKWDSEAPICKVESRERLLNDKFIEGEYSPTLSPTVGVVNITIAGSIVSIINLDESTETVTTAFRVGLTWYDQRLSWDVFHYGVSKVRVDHDTVWKPTLKLLRSADKDFSGFPKSHLTMFNTGQVTWIIEDIIVTTCDLDHFLFPFDTITCPVCLHTDVENDEELICSGNTTTADVYGCHDPKTLKSGEWTATVNMTVADRRKACLSMLLVRDPTFHMCTTVSPSIVLVLLMCITFFIPIDKGDRLSWGMSILLSMFVSLVVISDYLPKTGHFPLFGVLTIVAITLAGLFMWLTTVVIALSGKEGDMPDWAVVFFLKYMAMAMLLGDMTKKREVKKETPAFTEDVMIMRFNPLHQAFPPPLDIADDDNEPMPRRRRNHLRVLASINTVMWGLKDSMADIRNSLDSLNSWLKKQDEADSIVQTESDWMMLSHVLDRLCLIVYLATLILAVPIVYHIG